MGKLQIFAICKNMLLKNPHARFHVLDSFEKEIDIGDIPSNYSLHGLTIRDVDKSTWLNNLMNAFEKNNLYSILDKYFGLLQLFSENTIALTYDNVIIAPDFLNNLSSYLSHPDEVLKTYLDIQETILHRTGATYDMVPHDEKWYKEQLDSATMNK